MKRSLAISFSSFALLGLVACGAPENDVEGLNEANPQLNSEENDSIRENQLESDQRARQERQDIMGDPESPLPGAGSDAGSDPALAEQVQAELDTQLPGNQLIVDATTEGDVTISGETFSEAEWQEIEAIASNVEGVRSVTLETQVEESSGT
jgi:hyperosmotically inducible protein